MIPGLLKSLQSNRGAAVRDGLKLFEVSDVMLLDPEADVGAKNQRRLAALYTGPTAGFEIIHGLVDRIMMLLEVPVRPYKWAVEASADSASASAAAPVFGRGGLRYYVEPATNPSYFPGRGANLILERAPQGWTGGSDGVERIVAGSFGVLHPKVLQAFELGYPVSVVEINIEHFISSNE
jgi:phenylalanyl-tRNA synthetase beta chain